ncbi:MAG: hypothetical protein U0794_12460 [Isosphaeraceae bacterium]
MRSGKKSFAVGLAAMLACLASTLVALPDMRGDEPGSRLGRLFRFGNSAPSRPAAPPRIASNSPRVVPDSGIPPDARIISESLPPSAGLAPGGGPPPLPTTGNGSSPRILPQPRVSRAVTESDPLVTRTTLGRSDGGNLFGLFIQVYADGTVIDNEGVHQVGREGIRGVLEAMESSDLFRTRGHCGGPPTDFVEQVHVVVFERSLGRLRANAFSFSGNTQGCDSSVRRLQAAIDNLQLKLSPPAGTPASALGTPNAALPPTVAPVPSAATAPAPPLAPAPTPTPPPVLAPSLGAPADTLAPPLTGPTTIRLNEGIAPR